MHCVKSIIQRFISFTVLCATFLFACTGVSVASDDEFVPAYQNEIDLGIEDANHYITYREGRKYYTSGKKNGIRVNENNEESTDETIGILTFVIVPATLVYMNLIGWWE